MQKTVYHLTIVLAEGATTEVFATAEERNASALEWVQGEGYDGDVWDPARVAAWRFHGHEDSFQMYWDETVLDFPS